MHIPNWLALNIYVMIIISIIFIFAARKDGSKNGTSKFFEQLLMLIFIAIIFDSIGKIPIINHTTEIVSKIGKYFVFIIDPLIMVVAFYYINAWFVQDIPISDKWKKCLTASAVVNFMLVSISTIGNLKWFYYYENYNYIRGNYFALRSAYLVICGLCLMLYSCIYSKYLPQQHKKILISFPFMAMIFGILQIFFKDLSLEYVGYSASCLMILLYIQNEDANVDKLTNLFNRRLFDMELKRKIIYATEKDNFALISVDIDFFKEINDKFGHKVGDDALADVSQILLSCFRKTDIVARHGGDEFCIIATKINEEQLEKLIKRIREKVDNFNRKKKAPYKISLSIGGLIYDLETKPTLEEFNKMVDEKMYLDKQSHHAIRK